MLSSDPLDQDPMSSLSLPQPSQYHLCNCHILPSSSNSSEPIEIDDSNPSEPAVEEISDPEPPAAKKRKGKAVHKDDISEDGLSETELELSKSITYLNS